MRFGCIASDSNTGLVRRSRLTASKVAAHVRFVDLSLPFLRCDTPITIHIHNLEYLLGLRAYFSDIDKTIAIGVTRAEAGRDALGTMRICSGTETAQPLIKADASILVSIKCQHSFQGKRNQLFQVDSTVAVSVWGIL